ncbi:MAG: 6-bladed beta-propeller [Acidobacteriota bacterium]
MKKRLLWVIVISLVLVGCQKQKLIDSFKLGEILFSVDTSQEKIIKKGVYDIRDFDVDSKGNIFILVPQTDTDWIYKFDSSGDFVCSFARKGSGPGEIQVARRININENDLVTMDDPSKLSLLVFSNLGEFMKSYSLPSGIRHVDLLKNGCFLTTQRRTDPENENQSYLVLTLYDESFNTSKELAVYTLSQRTYQVFIKT